jgi:hypothetical protein
MKVPLMTDLEIINEKDDDEETKNRSEMSSENL